MWTIILLALVAVARTTPLTGWGGYGYHIEDVGGHHVGYESKHTSDADHFANKITHKAIDDQLAHTEEAIKGLQKQLEHHPHGWTGDAYVPYGDQHYGPYDPTHHTDPSVASKAINYLKDDLKHQQHKYDESGLHHSQKDDPTYELHHTVKAGVEAVLTADDVHREQSTNGVHVPKVAGLHAVVFQSRLEKLIDEHNEQELENQISHHHHWAQQLHHQQEFVSQQKQQIEAQKALVHYQGDHDNELDRVHHHLQLQEYYLMHEQLAHHLAILQLQEALVHKKQQILEDTVAENNHEKEAHEHEVEQAEHHKGYSYGSHHGQYDHKDDQKEEREHEHYHPKYNYEHPGKVDYEHEEGHHNEDYYNHGKYGYEHELKHVGYHGQYDHQNVHKGDNHYDHHHEGYHGQYNHQHDLKDYHKYDHENHFKYDYGKHSGVGAGFF